MTSIYISCKIRQPVFDLLKFPICSRTKIVCWKHIFTLLKIFVSVKKSVEFKEQSTAYVPVWINIIVPQLLGSSYNITRDEKLFIMFIFLISFTIKKAPLQNLLLEAVFTWLISATSLLCDKSYNLVPIALLDCVTRLFVLHCRYTRKKHLYHLIMHE